MKPEIQKVIEDYKASYTRANGDEIDVEYVRGWFVIRSRGVTIGTRHRRSEVESFTRILNSRPALTARKDAHE